MTFIHRKEDAAGFKYGKGFGFHGGVIPYDKRKCVYEVWAGSGAAYSSHQCTHKNGHGPDGLYCKLHAKKIVEIENFYQPRAIEKFKKPAKMAESENKVIDTLKLIEEIK